MANSTYYATIRSHILLPTCQGTVLRLSGVIFRLFTSAHRMAILVSEAHPGPLDLKRLASLELPIVLQAHSAVMGHSLVIVSIYTWPDS